MICIKKVFTSPSLTQGIFYIPSLPNEWIILIGKKSSEKKSEKKKEIELVTWNIQRHQ